MSDDVGLVGVTVTDLRCDVHGVPLKTYRLASATSEPICDLCAKAEADAEEEAREADLRRRLVQKRQAELVEGLVSAGLAPRFHDRRFETYLAESESQKRALAAVRRLADRIVAGESVGGAIFTGRPGTGKNHLASAICHFVHDAGKTFVISTASKILRDIKASWSKKGSDEREILRRFTQADLLVIDEVGVQFGSVTEQNYLTEIINDRYEWRRPTVILSNLPIDLNEGDPADLQTISSVLGERAMDRLREGGMAVLFTWESFRKGGRR